MQVLSIACPGLVELVEAGLFDDPCTQEKLQEYLAPAIAAWGGCNWPFMYTLPIFTNSNPAIIASRRSDCRCQ